MLHDAFSLAQILGYAAFVLGVGSFLQKNDRHFKLYMTGECIAYALHFYMLGNYTATASSIVSVARSVLSLYTRSLWIALTIVAINIALGLALVKTWTDWLPLIASCTGTLALFLLQGIPMRLLMLVGTLLWLANNIITGSYGGTALEIVIAIVNCTTIWRLMRDQRLAGTPAETPRDV
ncbi:YgjV family protein [Uliginosibacterium sp. H1]|uniref:YgjV family protein n=1 Tax=Uliginosibacterium sp. H1 TaxID=3114757 RepID=UPI002E19E6F6|nr:YgjV family protein [Uliginosibacterium sp. H1]